MSAACSWGVFTSVLATLRQLIELKVDFDSVPETWILFLALMALKIELVATCTYVVCAILIGLLEKKLINL